MSKSKSNEFRMFEIMNECERLDLSTIKEWLNALDCSYLIVKHDKDLPRTAHYHIFVKLANARDIKDIAKFCKVETRFIQRIKSWKNALAYGFHLTEGAIDDGKHIYDDSAVDTAHNVDIGAVFKLSKEYDDKRQHDKALKDLLYKYGNCEISKTTLIKTISAEDYNACAMMFKRMQEYRIMKVRDRNMNVIYITGGSGSGKTTLAKYMARVQNYDYFISGSGKDVLDGYDKEECIILDDLRGDVFTKAELFKLTDNNTNSSVKSRFKNKDISYCKLMIITSIKTPKDLYNWETWQENDKDETFEQFARRIGNSFLYISKDDGAILKCSYDLEFIKTTKQLQDVNMNDVFALLGIEKRLGGDLLNDIFKKVKTQIDEQKEKYEKNDDLPF